MWGRTAEMLWRTSSVEGRLPYLPNGYVWLLDLGSTSSLFHAQMNSLSDLLHSSVLQATKRQVVLISCASPTKSYQNSKGHSSRRI
jgi:hypothetical protein